MDEELYFDDYGVGSDLGSTDYLYDMPYGEGLNYDDWGSTPSDPYNTLGNTFAEANPSGSFQDYLGGAYSDWYDPMSSIYNLGSDFLGQASQVPLDSWLKLGGGALSFYLMNKQAEDAKKQQQQQIEVARRGVDLQEDQFALPAALDWAKTQNIVSRMSAPGPAGLPAKMTPEQAARMLEQMRLANTQTLTRDPYNVSSAFQTNPFGQQITPEMVQQWASTPQQIMEQSGLAPQQLAGGGLLRGLGKMAPKLRRENLAQYGMEPSNLPQNWLKDNEAEIIKDYLANMRRLAERQGRPMDEASEIEHIKSMLSQGFACGGMYRGGGSMDKGALGLVASSSSGQEDDVNASLSGGEYVFDSDTVSALGDGNTTAGAKKLDQMREAIRRHKRSAPANKIPPKAKGPLSYLGSK